MGGRLPEELAAISATATLLSTDCGVKYAPGAFTTNQNELTSSRIIIYDAHGPKAKMPYGRPEVEGRTDMLGRNSLLDMHHYRIIHTLLLHSHHGGIFEKLGKEFVASYRTILRKYGLDKLLGATQWVFNPDKRGQTTLDSTENHEAVIGAVTQAWFKAAQEVDNGVIGEVQGLINTYYRKMSDMRQAVIQQNPQEYRRYLEF